jgi:hypothetical protein
LIIAALILLISLCGRCDGFALHLQSSLVKLQRSSNVMRTKNAIRRNEMKMVIQGDRESKKQQFDLSSLESSLGQGLSKVESSNGGKQVIVTFDDIDSTQYLYHTLWLRDACRDSEHVVAKVGERQLTATAAMLTNPEDLSIQQISILPDGETMEIVWANRGIMIENTENSIYKSTFSASFLREYAPVVGKKMTTTTTQDSNNDNHNDDLEWLRPYSGFPHTKAPSDDMMNLWNRKSATINKFEYHDLFPTNEAIDKNIHLDILRTLVKDGFCLVENAPSTSDSQLLHDFVYEILGGLQKDPAREMANWQITKKEGATSISYAHDKRLINHTDQSIPPHGIPGLVLVMHYIAGVGENTLVDGFAVAKKLRKEDPKAFDLLATYGYDAERDFIASRVDSLQAHTKTLLVSRKHPIFTLDEDGELSRITYNEVFRTPLTLPFDVFEDWFKAFNKFVKMLHSPDYEIPVPMKEGTFLIMHNWRVLHGRTGGKASTSRTVVGGTITRESFFSKATELLNVRDEFLDNNFKQF